MTKIIWEYLVRGILWGCAILVGNLLVNSFLASSEAYILLDDFPRMALGYVLLGLGVGSGTIIYTFERLNIFQQTAIHVAISVCSFAICRLIVFGHIWYTFSGFARDLAIFIAIFAVVGRMVYKYHELEVAEMNEALKKMEKKND